MKHIKDVDGIYFAIDELIKLLAKGDTQRVSDILSHRLYKVSWTSQSELLEELSLVFMNILKDDTYVLEPSIVSRITEIKQLIDEIMEIQR